MPYIIDGNNLIGSSPDISIEDPEARLKLIQIIKKFQENKKHNITVVFDGVPENGVRKEDICSKFCVVYPPEGSTADEEIKRILKRYHHYKDVILITSDRELKAYAKEKGAKTINSIEFYFELKRISRVHGKAEESQKRIEAEISEHEVNHWMKIFDES